MAKSFVSPGVFTNEVDASFLGPGVGAIGAALIGTAPKGPAFVPVTVTQYSEYVEVFGDLDTGHLLPYAARAYLRNSSAANVVRVLGPEGREFNGTAVNPGYSAESVWGITAFTGSTGAVMALLEVTGSRDLIVTDLGNDQFFVEITGSVSGDEATPDLPVTASFLTSSALYVSKVLNTDPAKFEEKGYYVRDVYDYAYKILRDGNAGYSSASFGGLTPFTFGYNSGSSPWVTSQLFGGSNTYNLFRIHTLGHGEAENGRFKLSVKNVRPAVNAEVNPYGRFDLEVRNFGDTDRNKGIVENFPNLSFDPDDPNYICRAIGDRFLLFDNDRSKIVEHGDYENRSKLIRIELTTGSLPAESLPWGFRGLEKADLTITGSALAEAGPEVGSGLADLPLVKDLLDKPTQAEAKTYMYWGMETQLSGNVAARFTKYPKMTGSDADFSLRYVSGSTLGELRYDTALPVAAQKGPGEDLASTTLSPAEAQFTFPLAFGFDGFDRRLEDPLENESQLLAGTQIGVQALRQGVDVISDPDFIDINLLAIPGIYASRVVDYAIDAVVDRSDAFYVADITGSTVDAVVQEVKGRGFDNSYSAVYYPSIKVFDDLNNVSKTLPASIPAIGTIAFNDRVAAPWFAPAGLNRAGLSPDTIGFTVLSITDQLTAAERDKLYENRVNPIARFPDVPQGVVWGQKTLQLASSALDRINVRRLMIRAKKLVASAVKFLVFEPNDATTQTRFRQLVNPILADIQQKQGLEKFLVVMDESTNPPEVRDRNIMAGKIFLVPTKAAEFISIDFIISPSGASFEEA
jgi:hypothetical protein